MAHLLRSMLLSSFKLDDFLGPLFVEDAIAAVSATYDIVGFQSVGSSAIAASVNSPLIRCAILWRVHIDWKSQRTAGLLCHRDQGPWSKADLKNKNDGFLGAVGHACVGYLHALYCTLSLHSRTCPEGCTNHSASQPSNIAAGLLLILTCPLDLDRHGSHSAGLSAWCEYM